MLEYEDNQSGVSASVFLRGTPVVQARRYTQQGLPGYYITVRSEGDISAPLTVHFRSEVQARQFFYALHTELLRVGVIDADAEDRYPVYDEDWDALGDEKAHAS